MTNAGGNALSIVLLRVLLVCITFKLFCSVPLLILVIVDIIQNLYQQRTGKTLSRGRGDYCRFAIWVATTLLSMTLYNSLQYATALIGINSMLISIVLPIVFYVVLHYKTMHMLTKLGYATLITGVILFTGFITCVDVSQFIKSLTSQPEDTPMHGGGSE